MAGSSRPEGLRSRHFSFRRLPLQKPRGVGGLRASRVAYLAKKQYDKAIEDFSEAIRLDPGHAISFMRRGNAYKARQEHDKAINDYSEAIRLDPKSAVAFYNRGLAYSAKKQFDKAIDDCSEAIRIDSKHVAAFNSRGLNYSAKKEYDRAKEDYAEVLRLDPHSAQAFNNLAWLLATCPRDSVRDGKKAIVYATKAGELTAWKSYHPISTLAAAHAECGDFKEAVKWGKMAIAIGIDDNEDLEVARKQLKQYEEGKPYRED